MHYSEVTIFPMRHLLFVVQDEDSDTDGENAY